jgi:hypothetical protein
MLAGVDRSTSAVAAGLSGDRSGHSLRRGFATAARASGHDPLEIARAGGGATAPASWPVEWTSRPRKALPLLGIGL